MTNLDKAIGVLDGQGAFCGQCSREPGDSLDDCRDCAAVLKGYAQALEESGLLAPDLPEPTKLNRRNEPIWETEGHARVRTPGGFPVALNGPFGEGWDMFPVEARDIAYALLAACDYAEKEHIMKECRQ